MVGVPGEAVAFEHRGHLCGALGFAQSATAEREFDVLGNRRHHDLVVGIGEDESDLLAYVAALLRRVQAVDVDVSFRRNDQSVDHASEGRLAASVRTHDPDSLLAQSQIYLLKDRSFTEAVSDVLEDDLTHRRLIRHHGLVRRDHRVAQ